MVRRKSHENSSYFIFSLMMRSSFPETLRPSFDSMTPSSRGVLNRPEPKVTTIPQHCLQHIHRQQKPKLLRLLSTSREHQMGFIGCEIQKLIFSCTCNKRMSIYAFIFIVFYSLKRTHKQTREQHFAHGFPHKPEMINEKFNFNSNSLVKRNDILVGSDVLLCGKGIVISHIKF